MSLATILFIVVMLHLVVGFGYVFYKLEFGGKSNKKTDQAENDSEEKA
jgi:flagellar basal body-associated protein FliL